jgi:hypothetical protein
MRKLSALVFVSLFIAAAAACGGPSTGGPDPDGQPNVQADCANIDVCDPDAGTATDGQCPEGCVWSPECKKCKGQRGIIIQQ